MNILVTGGTGFIGRALVVRLRRDGHRITVLSRGAARARSLLGTEADVVESPDADPVPREALERADAVINLAGEPLMGKRWSDDRKRTILDSRVTMTRAIVEGMRGLSRRPEVLVSASAVGYYGNGGDRVLTEDAGPGDDFLAGVCATWESEARRAEDLGVRVVTPRIGVVLGRGGGALDTMLPIFRAGLGGPVGPGSQYLAWIHLDDLVELLATAVTDRRYRGAYNATGPDPVTFRTFAAALGRALERPAFLPVPGLAVKAVFGEAASTVLEGQRAVPGRATAAGFRHRFVTVDEALRDVVRNPGITIGPVQGDAPATEYLRERTPSYVLETRTELHRPLDEVFAFFSRPENLGLITPPGMRFRLTRAPERVHEGAEIAYRLRVGPVPITWRTRIDAWEEGRRFVDSQIEGPYASWWHEHTFLAVGGRTVMTDRVFYAPPLGVLGRVANSLFVAGQLRAVFGYRAGVMRLRFGDATGGA